MDYKKLLDSLDTEQKNNLLTSEINKMMSSLIRKEVENSNIYYACLTIKVCSINDDVSLYKEFDKGWQNMYLPNGGVSVPTSTQDIGCFSKIIRHQLMELKASGASYNMLNIEVFYG